MPFKIVSSIEKNTQYLEIVPSQWENNGVCWWPKKGLSVKQKDESCLPDPESFFTVNCVLKRDKIPTFKEASSILDTMMQQSDSDATVYDADTTKRLLKKKSEKTVASLSTNPDLLSYINDERANQVSIERGLHFPQIINNEVMNLFIDTKFRKSSDSHRWSAVTQLL